MSESNTYDKPQGSKLVDQITHVMPLQVIYSSGDLASQGEGYYVSNVVYGGYSSEEV